MDANQSPPHFCGDPATDVAGDVNPAASEPAAEVSSGRSFNADVSGPHSGANPVDTAEVTAKDELLVGGIAGDVEEFTEGHLSVAFEDGDARDFAGWCAGTFLGGDTFQFNGDCGVCGECEGKRHRVVTVEKGMRSLIVVTVPGG
jgi:hypothetical protein